MDVIDPNPGTVQDNTGSGEGTSGTVEQPSFIDTLGDDYKGNELFKDVTDAKTLAARYVDLNTKHAEIAKSLPEVPKEPGEYKLDPSIKASEPYVNELKKTGHELRLTNKQLEGVAKFHVDAEAAQRTAYEDSKKADIEALKKEWGSDYDAKLEGAKTAVKALGFSDLFNEMDSRSAEAANNPVFIKFLVAVSEKISHDSINGTTNGSTVKQGKSFEERMGYTQHNKS